MSDLLYGITQLLNGLSGNLSSKQGPTAEEIAARNQVVYERCVPLDTSERRKLFCRTTDPSNLTCVENQRCGKSGNTRYSQWLIDSYE